MSILDGLSVGHPTYAEDCLFPRPISGRSGGTAEACRLCMRCDALRNGKANVGYPTEAAVFGRDSV